MRRMRVRRAPRAVLSGFPSKKIVKMRYVDSNLTLDPGAGTTNSHVYRLNSVFDVDFSGTGHGPMASAEWAAIYNRYTVLGAKIQVRAKPAGSTNIIAPVFGICIAPTSAPLSGFTSIDNILESKLCAGWKIASVSQPSSSGASGHTYPTVTRYWSAKKFFGVKDIQDGADFSALTNANPNKVAYASVWAASVDGGNAGDITAMVIIDLIVQYSDPKVLDGS